MRAKSCCLVILLSVLCNLGFAAVHANPVGDLPPRLPLSRGQWAAIPAFPHLRFTAPTWMCPWPGTDRLVVCEREGRVLSFRNDRASKETDVLLDLRHQCQGHHECGLLSLAFHPEFGRPDSANRGYFYVFYNYTTKPIQSPRELPRDQPTRNRLARFTLVDGALQADPKSELVLIDQLDEHVYHNAGSMFFHPGDGFLYLALGDEGDSIDRFGNAQQVGRDFFAGIIRIDVNQNAATSFPPRRKPATGSTAHYFVPRSNPFVGLPGALEEFYAIGLRNPYRLWHDPPTGRTWIADVGEDSREEINLLEAGGNYQWSYREGTRLRPEIRAKPQQVVGREIEPFYEYTHSDGNRCIIGGLVYRGIKHPDLAGHYLFGDHATGRIWALNLADDGKVSSKELCRMPTRGSMLTSFGWDHAGEAYLLELAEGRIYTLARAGTPELPLTDHRPLPRTLSATGLFVDTPNLVPRAEALPYTVNVPVWTDGARLTRWLHVPAGQKLEFAVKGEWKLPEGTVAVQQVDLQLDARRLSERRRLETRLLVRDADGGAYAASYRWRPDQSDADLVTDAATEKFKCIDKDGDSFTRTWHYLAREDCMACHNHNARFFLGLNARQLDCPLPEGRNQLAEWSKRGLFRQPLSAAELATCEPLAALDDKRATLDRRARSYLDANCSQCHRPNGVGANFDARMEAHPKAQFLVNGLVNNNHGNPAARVVLPGKPELSMALTRLGHEGTLRMPPVGHHQIDEQAVEVLTAWTRNLPRLSLGKSLVALGLPVLNLCLLVELLFQRSRRRAARMIMPPQRKAA